jgi:hypothetical protein
MRASLCWYFCRHFFAQIELRRSPLPWRPSLLGAIGRAVSGIPRRLCLIRLIERVLRVRMRVFYLGWTAIAALALASARAVL